MLRADRFRAARRAKDVSQAQMGDDLGMSLSGIRRIERGEVKMPRNIEAIANYLGVAPKWLLGDGTDALPITNDQIQVVPVDGTMVKLVGFVEAGVWREAVEIPVEDQLEFPVKIPSNFQGFEVIMLQVVGPSMNLEYQEGRLLICIKTQFAPREIEIKNGDHVIVQRQMGQVFETTVKEYQNGELWPRSSDPRYQTPLKLNEGEQDEVLIVGLVIGDQRYKGNLEDR